MRPPNRTAPAPAKREPVLAQAGAVGLAVGAYGLSYGVLAVAAGLSPLVATLSSVFVLAGGSQFAFVGVLAAGGNPMTGAIGGLLLNVRYLAFGLAIAPKLGGGGILRRLSDAYIVLDESVGLGLTAPPGEQARRYRIVGLSVVVTWIGMTALGAYGGQLIGDPEVFGLDAAFPAGFLALLAPWLRERRGQVAALAGTALALALTPVTPPGVPILAAGLGALLALRIAAPPVAAPPPDTTADASSDVPADPTSDVPSDASAGTTPDTTPALDANPDTSPDATGATRRREPPRTERP